MFISHSKYQFLIINYTKYIRKVITNSYFLKWCLYLQKLYSNASKWYQNGRKMLLYFFIYICF